MAERLVPVISLKGEHLCFFNISNVLTGTHLDYEHRKDEIREQLVSAAEGAGFLTLIDHGITIEEIEAQFALSRKFFELPLEIKKQNPHNVETNNGYEFKAQIRPSTGTPDQKESLWIQRTSEWPSDENVPGFRETIKFVSDNTKRFLVWTVLIRGLSHLLCYRSRVPRGLFPHSDGS
jgi:hypothetical protein